MKQLEYIDIKASDVVPGDLMTRRTYRGTDSFCLVLAVVEIYDIVKITHLWEGTIGYVRKYCVASVTVFREYDR